MKYLKIIILTVLLGVFFLIFSGRQEVPIISASSADSDVADTKITFLNVGQGDSILIESRGRIMIIDSGPDDLASQRLGTMLPPNTSRIDLALLTHAHDDHFSGFKKIFEKFSVNNIVRGDAYEESPAYQDFLRAEEAEKENGAKLIVIATSTTFKVGDCRADVYAPLPEAKNENDRSLVTKLNCLGHLFLLTGDLGQNGQSALIEDGVDVQSEIYKASHHGADSNNKNFFLDEVSPKTVVISVGKNSYGHPGRKFLEYAADSELPILRTDRLGSISFIISDKELKINNFK